jgi:hypothetical protein
MGARPYNLMVLKGKVAPEVEQVLIDVHSKIDNLNAVMTGLKQQIATLPTAAQFQQHANKVQQAIATMPGFDAVVAGVSTGHIQQSSILPIVSGAFAYTSTTNSITWFWDGTNGSSILTLTWPDKSVTQVPPSSQLSSGLNPSTTYNFFPYFDSTLGGIVFTSDAATGVGTQKNAFLGSILAATAIQSQDNHAPLNLSPMTAATTAAGTGGGSGGGRFGGCVAEDTELASLGGDIFSFLAPAEHWIEIRLFSGRKLRAVPEHRIFSEEGCLRMSLLRPGMRVVTVEGLEHIKSADPVIEKGNKRVVWVPKGNLYWGNSVLCHNIK